MTHGPRWTKYKIASLIGKSENPAIGLTHTASYVRLMVQVRKALRKGARVTWRTKKPSKPVKVFKRDKRTWRGRITFVHEYVYCKITWPTGEST